MDFFAAYPKHLDQLVRAELEEWEFEIITLGNSSVEFRGEARDALEYGLTSPFISRLYFLIHVDEISKEKDIYETLLTQVKWENFISRGATFKVQTNLIGKNQIQKIAPGKFNNSNYLNLMVKDAVCDYLKDKFQFRPNIDIKDPDHLFYLYVAPKGKSIEIKTYVDLLGLLSNRGYRTQRCKAPLRENLAAAIVSETNWNPDQEDFGDLMCGSGTLLSEAIIQGMQVSPQYLKFKKNFIFPLEKTNFLGVKLNEIKNSLHEQQKAAWKEMESMKFRFWFNDLDRSQLKTTRIHLIDEMGIPKRLQSFDQDATKFKNQYDYKGVVVMNAPYGKRIEAAKEEEKFYYDLGEVWKNQFKGSRIYLFTSILDGRKSIRLRTDKRVPFINGDIDCKLFEYKIT